MSHPDNIKAIIFDCDGVLVDTEYLKFLSWRDALQEKGIGFTLSDYLPCVGLSSKAILSKISQAKEIPLSDDIIKTRHRIYASLQQKGVSFFKEAVDLVHYLNKEKEKLGILLGLASSASHKEIAINLKQIELEHSFDVILSGSDDLDAYNDPEGKNKPKPYIYIEAAKRLGISPAQCLVVEDSAPGIEAAARAGMIPVAMPNRFTEHHDLSKAYYPLPSLSTASFSQFYLLGKK